MPSAIPVRGLGNKITKANKYAWIKLFFNGEIAGQQSTGSITIEVHLVDDLRANMLIGTDVLTP